MRSDSRLGGYRSQYPIPRHENSYLSNRSNNVSGVHSEHLRKMMEDAEMYPSGFAELLKYEQRNIKTFKGQINRQKQRINDDVLAFKTQINHVLEDLRLSLHAHLDRVYQGYIERYAKFKGELLQINRLKDQIQIECGGVNLPSNTTKSHFTSSTLPNNSETISRMQNGVKQIKKYHFLNYIAQLQKQRILPLNDLLRQIVLLNQYSNGYYQPKQFQKILQGLKDSIKGQVQRVYDNCHLYIREPDAILFKEQPRILDQVNPVHQYPPPPQLRQVYVERPTVVTSNLGQRVISESHLSNNRANVQGQRVATTTTAAYGQGSGLLTGSPLYGDVSQSEQAVKVGWVQKINITQSNKIRTNNSQIALCGLSLQGNKLALGFKDGSIQIVTNQGHLISTLKQHKASICTLSVVKINGQNYLASGSDNKCSSVVIWDTATWQIIQKFQNHKAAVTAIVDLQDDTHILTGSYDQKINIYNVSQGRFLYSLPDNQTPVTGAIITRNGARVVTCGLDKILNVWKIGRGSGNKVESLNLQRKIQNNVLILSMVASAWQSDMVVIGTKDGKIKMINIQKGQSYKTITCSDNHLVQVVLIQRQSKPFYPLVLTWPYKQNKLHIVNTESSSVSTKTITSHLQFGCGVSPKCFFLQRGGAICCVSHSEQMREVTVLRVEQSK